MKIMILITGFKDLSYQADLKSTSCQEETKFNQTGSGQIKSSEMIEWPLKNWSTWGKNSLSSLENEQATPQHNCSAPAVLTRICNLHILVIFLCFSTLQLLVKVKRKRKAKILLKPMWRQRNKRRKERRNFLMVMRCKRKRNTRS